MIGVAQLRQVVEPVRLASRVCVTPSDHGRGLQQHAKSGRVTAFRGDDQLSDFSTTTDE
jgi:hypothetical protein